MIAADCEKKILGIADRPQQGFLDMFRAIEREAALKDLPASTFVFPMYDENSGLQPGEYAAEIHFVVRKVA